MKIENGQLEDLANFLLDLKLKGFENRMRNKFLKAISEHMTQIREEHIQLLKEYCNLDENGQFITITEDGKTYYSLHDVNGYQKEYSKLSEEFFYIEVNEGNKEMLTTVKNIILNCDKEFSGKEAMQYENYCEIFENEILISN